MLCLSLGAVAQNYYTGPNSPIHTFGQKYAQTGEVVAQQSRMVFYRTFDSADTVSGKVVESNNQVTANVDTTGTLSEASTTFASTDVDVSGGQLSNWATSDNITYTATFTPTSGLFSSGAIGVKAGTFTDAAGNANKDTYEAFVTGTVLEENNLLDLSINTDTTPPTVIVSRSTNSTVSGAETITFTLSDNAGTSFDASDIFVTPGAGTLSNFVGDGTVFTATFTPTANSAGSVTIGVKAGKFSDPAGNLNKDTFDSADTVSGKVVETNNAVTFNYKTDNTAPTIAITGPSGAVSGPSTITFTLSEVSSDFMWDPNVDVLQVTGTKVLDTAGSSPGTISQTINGLIVGQTYAWSFTNAREDEVPDVVKFELTGATSLSQTLSPASNAPSVVNGTFVAQSTTVTMTFADTTNNGAADRGVLIDNVVLSRVDAVPAPNGSLSAGGTLTAAATAQADALTYSGSPLIALAGNDTITATASDIQSKLAAGGFINGGAGIDTLKLAAGTTLNLETLTGNQTVQKIQEVEILQMQGGSSLTLSANNVLSLGGSNASTMAPFSFSSTQQVADGSVAATGSTSSTGKVQMVIQGGTGDALKLDALATDGVSSTAGVLGNSGLTGTWAYKGQVQLGTITYKVYDHSTTQAQVLVDVPVVVTTVSPIAITAIDDANGSSTSANGSKDTGTSASDFITSETTLVYRGTVPVEYNDANHDVFVEILNSSGTVVQSGTATVSNGTWSLDKTASALSAGNYTIRSTIVNQGTTTTTSSFGSQGVDTQALVIDTTAPTIIVARANNSTATLSTGQTETITFTLSEASTNFDVSDVAVSGGTLSNFGGSGTSYSATFTPTADTSGTGSISVASSKFSDAAGNQNADGAEGNNTASVPYVTAVPTQTVTFSSMTKDSSLALDNADWTTADGSAGRLVSGTLDAVLITGQVLKVYSNGTYIGDAVVNGKAWEITDTTGYTTGWTYTAKVQDGSGNTGPTTTQIVNTDFTEAAPVITSVIDTANASIGIGGTTTSALSTVSGTGTAGDTVYLYDNTGTNLVGSTTVAAGGAWSISGLATNDAVGGGTNTFSARQMDSLGNVSVLSNTWTVTAAGSNLLTNGNFASGFTGFSSGLTSTGTTYSYTSTAGGFAVGPLSGAGAMNPVNTATTANSGPTAYTFGTWSKKTIASYVNPNGAFSGDALYGGRLFDAQRFVFFLAVL
ncbi:Ig-like domain-containing protein [Limnohabitans sp.]|uniref:beta strand repeat-containing protein n=1 Tax=Limnohabitans sp. TaxID=1907725 RepID=UPI00263276DB|nr:Ig-like domain-containing protein [Limnohabitans sp.]